MGKAGVHKFAWKYEGSKLKGGGCHKFKPSIDEKKLTSNFPQ